MTSGERVIKNVIEGINRAFGDLEVGSRGHTATGTFSVLVRALDRQVPGQGVQFSGNGFSLTIGDRVAHFSSEGRLLEQGQAPVEHSTNDWAKARDTKPKEYARYCRGEITEWELFAFETPAETKKGEAVGLAEKVGAKK